MMMAANRPPVALLSQFLRSNKFGIRHFSSSSKGSSKSPLGRSSWFGIPITLGVACIGLVHLRRQLLKDKDNPASVHPMTWQLLMFLQIPTRLFSRVWGVWMEKEIHENLRVPLFGLYTMVFGCNMKEAEEPNLRKYKSFKNLFIRKLQDGNREIDSIHQLVSPIDGRVLHFGVVDEDHIEQVKGVSYSMNAFLGPEVFEKIGNDEDKAATSVEEGTRLYHCVLYLSPGDCHHFHSPADWRASFIRHLPGELLTVAPWAARKMPGLFALNERVTLNGRWRYGTFIFAAVGAYNVGSISMDVDQELQTNLEGRYLYGSYSDRPMKTSSDGRMSKGDHIGVFNMGSSIVLIFEAPESFEFTVTQNQTIKLGEALGRTKLQ